MNYSELNLRDFNYELPADLIAQMPLEDRSKARLLVYNSNGTIEHSSFEKLCDHLPHGTLLLYNDSRVLPGRLIGETEHGGKVELMLLRPLDPEENSWQALGRPFRKLSPGFKINFSQNCIATVVRQNSEKIQTDLVVKFNLDLKSFSEWLEDEGFIPLPPYISRPNPQKASLSLDRNSYQTVYAKENGSVAAPTAGLHFDETTWNLLKASGIETAPVTLHVGGGTFLPVKTEKIEEHLMHKESVFLSKKTFDQILAAIDAKRPIVAVGTTTLRCLESFAVKMKVNGPDAVLNQWLDTDLFIYPKHKTDLYKPWAINGLITNFHQPESSLLMLVSALSGYEAIRKIYNEAIFKKYRFFSYGDTSLLWL